jgi:hypothetical protein
MHVSESGKKLVVLVSGSESVIGMAAADLMSESESGSWVAAWCVSCCVRPWQARPLSVRWWPQALFADCAYVCMYVCMYVCVYGKLEL